MKQMHTMKKIFLWFLMIVGMFILSEFLINVGLNSTYHDMKRKDQNPEIVVYQADATYINGRIRGIIKKEEPLAGKYLKIELYSERDILLGRRYLEIDQNDSEVQPFELLFKTKQVKAYKAEIVKQKEAETETEIEVLPKEWTKPEIMLMTAMTLLIFWG